MQKDQKFLFASFLSFLPPNLWKKCKNTEKEISTSIWSAEHPNSGQNIQQLCRKIFVIVL